MELNLSKEYCSPVVKEQHVDATISRREDSRRKRAEGQYL